MKETMGDMSQQHLEIEIKLAVRDADALAEALRALGFDQISPRTFEANQLLDTPESSLRSQGKLLRVRAYGNRHTITYKGPAAVGKHKARTEFETTIGSIEPMQMILEELGYRPTFRYEKYRSEFSDGVGHVTIDETPIGNYMELEGEPQWIDEMAARLGYCEDEYLTKSYGRLYAEHCAGSGVELGDMVFDPSKVDA